MVSSGSHTTLGPGTMVTLGPHEGPYEWGADTTLYRVHWVQERRNLGGYISECL